MKTKDEVEIILRDGSIIIGKILKKKPAGIIVKTNEYYPFSTEKTIAVEMYISKTEIKTIHKKESLC
jgi:hypothetical protein